MEQLVEEFGHPTYTSFPVVAARLLLATIFGAAIGFEREWRNRPAGLRTHILICVAAATYRDPDDRDRASADVRLRDGAHRSDTRRRGGYRRHRLPGGRNILFSRGEVHGLTTGAGMWLAGAIGVACGFGLWQIALFGTLVVLVVLACCMPSRSNSASARTRKQHKPIVEDKK